MVARFAFACWKLDIFLMAEPIGRANSLTTDMTLHMVAENRNHARVSEPLPVDRDLADFSIATCTPFWASVVAFEQAYEVTKDNEIKITVAEYIKNACFRFRTDPEYQAKYEKYEAVVASGK